MAVMRPDHGLRVRPLGVEQLAQSLEHVGVAQIPAFGRAFVHRAIISLRILDETGIGGGIEPFLAILRDVAQALGLELAQHRAPRAPGSAHSLPRWRAARSARDRGSRASGRHSARAPPPPLRDRRRRDSRSLPASSREIVEIEPVKAGHRLGHARLIVAAQPADEGFDLRVAPHPGREAAERRLLPLAPRPMADEAIDIGRVGPVGLDRDDVEAVSLDQPARDRGAGAVEFAGAVARLAEQDDPRLAEPVERAGEGGIVDRRQQLRGGAQPRRERVALLTRLGPAFARRSGARSGPGRDPPSRQASVAGPRDRDQALHRAGLADRHDQGAADGELALQRFRAHGCRSPRRGSRRTALPPAGRRAVALDDADIGIAEPRSRSAARAASSPWRSIAITSPAIRLITAAA